MIVRMAVLALALSAGAARAATVSATLPLDAAGADLLFALTGLGPVAGGGLVTVTSLGSPLRPGVDLDDPDEFFELAFDGVTQGAYSCAAGPGVAAIPGSVFNLPSECIFSLSVPVGAALLADGGLEVGVLLSDAVVPQAFDAIRVTLTYEPAAVPLPASGFLLLGALGGAAALWRSRRREPTPPAA